MTRLGICALFCALLGSPSAGAASLTLAVVAHDTLPGFRQDAVAAYLATRMEGAYLAGWDFVPGSSTDPDRVEWHFTADPYAGGSVRQYFPQAQVQRLFGARHLITAEVRLYRDGQYQTMLFGQMSILGGASDPDLSDFVKRIAQQMLEPGGALDAIEQGARH